MSNVRAINGFEIQEKSTGESKDIVIRYKINGEFFTQSKYSDVDEEKIKKVNELLEDYTEVNSEAEELCRTIPMITIISAVEEIIFERDWIMQKKGFHYWQSLFWKNVLAGVEGLEPSQAVLETDVLPLTLYSYKNYFLIITQKI